MTILHVTIMFMTPHDVWLLEFDPFLVDLCHFILLLIMILSVFASIHLVVVNCLMSSVVPMFFFLH